MLNPDRSVSAPKLPITIRVLTASLRLLFNLLYHQFAWTYDGVAWIVSLGGWQKWVLSVMPHLNGPRTLEIGFGPGHLLTALSQKGLTPFGIDESRQMIRISKRRLTRLGVHPNLVRGNAMALPFAGKTLHQVVMTFPSDYILNSNTLAEIHRVLVDDGMVVILPLAWITGKSPLERAAAWLTHITGESPEWHEQSLEPLKNAGFQTDWELVDLGSSKILLIRMVKSASSNAGLHSL